jgi:ribosome-associated protein
MDHDKNDASQDEEKSKSQVKREMHALQALGEELVNLSADQFARFALPSDLVAAIAEARRIRSHGARKRQLQYIGKLMRRVDAESIQEKLEALRGQSRRANAELHRIEQWRDRLIEEGDQALEALVNEYPQLDRQSLRQLQRNANKEKTANKPPQAARQIFRYLRDLIQNED